MSHKRNITGIVSHATGKREKSTKAANDAIGRLFFEKQPVNFNTVAKEAGVSKTFLYNNDGLRKRIEELREKQSELQEPKQLKQRMNDASKDALIAVKNKRIADVEAENKRLKSVLSKKLGEEYDSLNYGGFQMGNRKYPRGNSEPIYDDYTIEEHAKQEIKELLTAIVDHILKLQGEVVSLRKTIYHDNPYADIYSDLCPSFEGFAAYKKYHDVMKKLE